MLKREREQFNRARAIGLGLARVQRGDADKRLDTAAHGANFARQFERAPIIAARVGILTARARDRTQVFERDGNAPRIANLAANRQRVHEQAVSLLIVLLPKRAKAQVVEAHGDAEPVLLFPKQRKTRQIRLARGVWLGERVERQRQIAQRLCRAGLIGELPAQRQTRVKQLARRNVFAGKVADET